MKYILYKVNQTRLSYLVFIFIFLKVMQKFWTIVLSDYRTIKKAPLSQDGFMNVAINNQHLHSSQLRYQEACTTKEMLKMSCLLLTLNLLIITFTSYSRIFHSFGDVTITGEGLQIFTYTRHSWPLSSEGC